MKHFTEFSDVDDVQALVNEALRLKENPFAYHHLGQHKTLGLVFLNPSLRTRMSTQKAAYNLGMQVMVLNVGQESWALETQDGVVMNGDRAEHIKDAVAVMGQYCDIIGLRSFASLINKEEDYKESMLHAFLQYAGKPVISLESALRHPLQSLADLLTIKEHSPKTKPKVVLSWAPHVKALPQAVPNSFAEWVLGAGYELCICHPEGYELDEQFSRGANILYNQKEAMEGADFVYVKNWSSFKSYGKIENSDPQWLITQDKIAYTNDAKVMHCLPVRRNVVITDEVLDGPNAIVIQQAANREFAAQAVLKCILENQNL